MEWIKHVVISSWLLLSVPFAEESRAQSSPAAKPSTASLEGTVVDAETRKPITGAVVSARSESGTMRAQEVATVNGAFQLILDPKQPYQIITRADGYEPATERLTFTSSSTNRLYGKQIRLYRAGTKPVSATPTVAAASSAPVPTATVATAVTSGAVSSASTAASTAPAVANVSLPPASVSSTAPRPVNVASAAPAGPRVTPPKTLDAKVSYTPPLVVGPTGSVTRLNAIQFVQSKAELLSTAQPALDQLLDFMKTHATAEIELAGHTDNQGDFDENIRLSRQRVELVKEFLVKNGVAAGRISTRGYGPTRPIASNNAEASRQLNRRVEMTVLKQ